MKAATALKGALFGAALLAAPEFSPETAEAMREINAVSEDVDPRAGMIAIVEECISGPLNQEPMPEKCDPGPAVTTARAADDLMGKIEENLPDVIIVGLGSYLAIGALCQYRKHKNKN